jgi:MinD-like ATPase involved in chromosome partitioning or flagellar assembly
MNAGWVKDVNFDEEMFTVSLQAVLDDSDDFQDVTLMVPQSYPKGVYTLSFGEFMEEFKKSKCW